MEKVTYEEIFQYPIKEFTVHLERQDNDRILFSGKYGIGKTSFLKDYFSQSENASKYDVIHLFPVNYSIASNEDIIRYIKYDIIFQLLEKNRQIIQVSKTYLQNLPEFFKKNLDKIAAALVYMIPKIGKDVVDAYEKWNGLAQEFLAFHDKSNHGDGDKLAEYLKNIETADGGLFESDIITDIIVKVIKDNGGRQSVLVVDDLDRLDPEHVFRIMNVFAAHFDNPGSFKSKSDSKKIDLKNKFGFDKIILVCDFVNIENIFSHKYGKEADFIGYADKFYSSDVYHFDNKPAINSIVQNCLKQAIKINIIDDLAFNYYNNLLIRDGFVQDFMQYLINNSAINLRSVLKAGLLNIEMNAKLKFENGISYESYRLPITLKLKMLRDVVGDAKRLVTIFKKLKAENKPAFEYFDKYVGLFLFIINIKNKITINRDDYQISFNGKKLTLNQELGQHYELQNVRIYEDKSGEQGKLMKGDMYTASTQEFWESLLMATYELIEIGYLK
jgi:hypothetical protein